MQSHCKNFIFNLQNLFFRILIVAPFSCNSFLNRLVLLTIILFESKASDTLKLNFRKECCSFLQNVTLKLIERNPLCFKLVRGISCLSPTVILSSNSLVVGDQMLLQMFLWAVIRYHPSLLNKVKAAFCIFHLPM